MRVKEIDRPVPETFLDALGEGLERIAYAFLIGVNSKGKKKKEKDHPIYISDDVVGILIKYDYPGNIRELRNIIFYSVAKNETVYLIPKDIPDYIFDSRMKNKYSEIRKLKELNKYYILETLKYFNYNVTKTSKELGISRQTIYRILKNVIKDDVK
ncbi:helix-turn-helix domain-containing protein [Hydrogenobacter thermophilus]|uniref:helix-turn-helix domain-containing protein n=1 Tax=Hydrogenobacter thermophilus TaxID=940 RepID=UPI0030FCF9F9